MNKGDKVIVIGGAGFIGSHVSDALSEKGYEVNIFDSKKPEWLRSDQSFTSGNILEIENLKKCTKGASMVFHFAGVADIKEANQNPLNAVETNILGTVNVLEACVMNKVNKFIFASSLYASSESGGIYGSTKQSCELLIENYYRNKGLNFSILRYGSLYGKRANSFNPIKLMILQALTEGKIEREGNVAGDEIRDYIHVEDAAQMTVEIAEKHANNYFMVTGSQTIKMKDLLSMINEMLGNKIKINYKKNSGTEHYTNTPFSFRPKISKKYMPSITLDFGQGILDMIYDVFYELDSEDLEKAKKRIADLEKKH